MTNKIEQLQNAFDNAIQDLMETFDELKAEIISVDKPEYETVDRDAEVGDKILVTNPNEDSAGERGEVFTVIDSSGGEVDVEEIQIASSHWAFKTHEYEVIVEPEQVPVVEELTANQQRAELIERAKELNEPYEDSFRFEVDEEKRTVFAYSVFQEEGRYNAVSGLSVCDSDEVFNEHIEKSIAVLKALEIDIPEEFLNAVQPDYYVPGHVITFPKELGPEWHYKLKYLVNSVDETENNLTQLWSGKLASATLKGRTQFEGDGTIGKLPITNDTNAIYSEVANQ